MLDTVNALDVLSILVACVVCFAGGCWFGADAAHREHERSHVSRRG